MKSRFVAWAVSALCAGAVALVGAVVADGVIRTERPRPMGYAIPGVTPLADTKPEAALSLAERLAAADPAAGEALFQPCSACHTIRPGGGNGVGPNLHAIVGAPIGVGRGGFAFSEALRRKGGRWDAEALDRWLENPAAFAPGTRMAFAGIESPHDRANLIAWLGRQGR